MYPNISYNNFPTPSSPMAVYPPIHPMMMNPYFRQNYPMMMLPPVNARLAGIEQAQGNNSTLKKVAIAGVALLILGMIA